MPLHKQIIIALVTGLVVGFVVMVLLDGPANAAVALGHGISLGG